MYQPLMLESVGCSSRVEQLPAIPFALSSRLWVRELVGFPSPKSSPKRMVVWVWSSLAEALLHIPFSPTHIQASSLSLQHPKHPGTPTSPFAYPRGHPSPASPPFAFPLLRTPRSPRRSLLCYSVALASPHSGSSLLNQWVLSERSHGWEHHLPTPRSEAMITCK
ncbi:hypothetical protein FA13DRAFT_1133146 [Coprinellus micaceus]|uniref:Uncharacterized protein n=1 Tax=Coprinellus micaceus TaxID=71717 RepID=A0A4Y7SW73_COPMI|nr:hypothetical protein FA13DRAFT_1133146 [Coprinellus micaceus]